MLLQLQFPLTDLRGFVHGADVRLPFPGWPTPFPSEEFVRFFGAVRKRPSGGISGWIGETAYCDARRALLFPRGLLGHRPNLRQTPHCAAADRGNRTGQPENPASTGNSRLYAAFRRFYFDGIASGKTEVGFATGLPSGTRPLAGEVGRVLNLDVLVRMAVGASPKHQYTQVRLHEAGPHLCQLYLGASSAGTAARQSDSTVAHAETPVLFVDMDSFEAASWTMPKFAKKVGLSHESPFDLFVWRIPLDGRAIGVWCLVAKDDVLDGAEQLRRNLRIYLLRLNAEHQCFKRVLKAIGQGVIDPPPRSPRAQLLQDYLNQATRRIGRCEAQVRNVAMSDQLEALAYLTFDNAEPGERNALMDRFRQIDVRTNITRKVGLYEEKYSIYFNIYAGTVNMSSGDIISVSGSTNVIIKSSLKDAQVSAGKLDASDVDKKSLESLLVKLEEALANVPKENVEQAEAVSAQVNMLVGSAAEAKPNRTTLKIIADGAKSAAEFLKNTAPSVVTIVGKIVGIVAKLHMLGL